jgi:tetratricopeptide (TPR) repeat protein
LEKLKESLPSLNELSRIDCLNQIGVEYTNFALMGCSLDNEDSALLYASKANNEASKFEYKTGKIYSLLLLAKGQLLKENYRLASKYISDPLLRDDKINSDTLLGEKYFLKGELALKKEEYAESEKNYNSASQFFLKARLVKRQAIVFRGLCDLYFRRGDYEKVLITVIRLMKVCNRRPRDLNMQWLYGVGLQCPYSTTRRVTIVLLPIIY